MNSRTNESVDISGSAVDGEIVGEAARDTGAKVGVVIRHGVAQK